MTKTRNYNAAEQLDSPEEIAAYIEAALEDGDPRVIVHALGTVARAREMSDIARKTGLRHESHFKALSPDGNPTLATALRVVRACRLSERGARRQPMKAPTAGRRRTTISGPLIRGDPCSRERIPCSVMKGTPPNSPVQTGVYGRGSLSASQPLAQNPCTFA